MTLLLLCIASFVLMGAQDAVGSSMMVAESRTLHRWPGLFDAIGTPLSRYGSVISAVVGVKYGLGSWQLAVVVFATMLADFSATNVVTPIAGRMLPKANAPWPIREWLRARLR